MRYLLVSWFALTSFIGFSQVRGMVWGEYGVKGKVIGDLDWGAELTTRFGTYGVETFFPQLTLRYKVAKWFRPSVDFRSIFNLDEYGNYLNSSRLNVNTDFKHAIKRFRLGARVRYQYSFNSLGNNENYDVEFDQALRFKPSIGYDFKGSFLSPSASIEFFYNPMYGPEGRQFRKYRVFLGVDFEFDMPHEITLGYIYDQEINRNAPETVHILSVAYTYNLSYKSKKSKKKKNSNGTIRKL
jgi:hypothetical protein